MFTDMIETAISNIEDAIKDEKSISCVSRNRLNKARDLLKLANDGIKSTDPFSLAIIRLYENNEQFRAITDSFLSNENNDKYCFYFLADEAERIITIGIADPIFLCYVLDDVKDRYKEVMRYDKSNSED